jgi:hypothetical protein
VAVEAAGIDIHPDVRISLVLVEGKLTGLQDQISSTAFHLPAPDSSFCDQMRKNIQIFKDSVLHEQEEDTVRIENVE